ncbi:MULTISPECIES: hypothetical protein [Nonomuraea]|uniref:Uncharacterized protein n=1 Tax=Nonomuraea mangrovi TaxID=2316207 RepID=A0ABW4SUB1_9ACTN
MKVIWCGCVSSGISHLAAFAAGASFIAAVVAPLPAEDESQALNAPPKAAKIAVCSV